MRWPRQPKGACSQAADIRIGQRQHVEELAQKAPGKMLFPMVFCVLPDVFMIVIGPASTQIYDTLIKLRTVSLASAHAR
jgi:pilus assembly protein TadC